MKSSNEITETSVALELLQKLKTEKEVRAFIKGEERDVVMDAAQNRINEVLKNPPKQGEEPGMITKLTNMFKGPGVEGEKGAADAPITGDDVVETQDAAATEKAEAALKQDSAEEAKQEQETAAKPKTYVSCEDVIVRMRSEGRKI